MKILILAQCFKVKVYALVCGSLITEAYAEREGIREEWPAYKMDLETWLKSVDRKENQAPCTKL